MQIIAELIFYGATFATLFLIALAGVLIFNPESRAAFLEEILKS